MTFREKRAELRALADRAWRRLRGGELTPMRAGLSVAVGLAIGVLPIWGVHWLAVLAVCLPLRLDAGVAYLAANISIPPVAPFITFAELEIGARVLRGAWLELRPSELRTKPLSAFAAEMACGTALLAVGTATLGGTITYGLTTLGKRRRAPLPQGASTRDDR